MIFTETLRPRLGDFDRTGRLAYPAILQLLETVAAHHADSVNDDVLESSRAGVAWIFVQWQVQLSARPQTDAPLRVETWARSRTAASAVFRDFTVHTAAGEEVLRAEAKFALLNRETGRLERITDALYAGYHPEDRAVFADPLPRLRPPAAFEDAQTLALRQSDLDYNGHVHNTRYLEFALEALPPGREFTRLSVVYNRPLAAQETVTLRHTAAGETHTLGVFAGSDLCTLLVLE